MDSRSFGKAVCDIRGGVVAGLAALTAVFCIPAELMQQHAYQSLTMLEKEFVEFSLIEGYQGSMTGNFTDCLMLGNAVYVSEEHSLLERVLYVYRNEKFEEESWAPGYSLRDYLAGIRGHEVGYARYWHGYLVVLKPLLWLTNFNTIRLLAAIVQSVLAGVLVARYARRGENFISGALVISFPFLYFFGLYSSLSLSICFYILAISLLAQEKWHEKFLEKGGYCEFFLIVGMATAYFDLLTYPLVTLGYPLCVALSLGNFNWKRNMCRFVTYCAEWTIGYLGMWAGKWVLTDVLTGGKIIENAVDTIRFRTGTAGSMPLFAGFISVLQKNLSVYQNWAFVLFLMAVGIILGHKFLKNKKMIWKKETTAQSLTVALVGILPFVWTLMVQNHSEEHWMFTYKIFSISAFAFFCAVGKLAGGDGPVSRSLSE